MDVLLIIDMQRALLEGGPKLDLDGVIERINRLSTAVRRHRGKVVWVQHSGRPGESTAVGTEGWDLLPGLERDDADFTVAKTLNDPFAGTGLDLILREVGARRILICGWATDFCVDAGVRSAISHGYDVVAVGDAHTVGDRPHMDAASVVRHHRYVWLNLIASRSVAVESAAELVAVMDRDARARGP